MRILLLLGVLLIVFGAQLVFAGLRIYSTLEDDNDAVREELEEAGLEADPEFLQPTSKYLIISIVGVAVLVTGAGLITPSILWKRRLATSLPVLNRKAGTEPSDDENEIWFCHSCGNLDIRNANYCPECGKALER
ncbi:MAG: hypothetical protein OEM29_05010 [Thermoplasmata archaeon]|nr:hypothetical protein [Thermoplasmata archaeon]